jgi:tetratricopeptide (TPR) repeat protein
MRPRCTALLLTACLTGIPAAALLGSSVALAVDTVSSKDGPDLTSVRAKIKVKDYQAALTELKQLADTHQHADVYSLLGFSLRKTGDYPTALTYYTKALDFDANHKGAREYLGELYVETGQLPKAREQLAVLEKLCPQGCEEREDLEKAIALVASKTN